MRRWRRKRRNKSKKKKKEMKKVNDYKQIEQEACCDCCCREPAILLAPWSVHLHSHTGGWRSSDKTLRVPCTGSIVHCFTRQ